jgi:hypothetical protein
MEKIIFFLYIIVATVLYTKGEWLIATVGLGSLFMGIVLSAIAQVKVNRKK